MGPVCTIMVGRLDDWLKVVADKQDISVDPGVLEWAGRGGVQEDLPAVPGAAATASGCCRPPSATTCTGASSLAATS